jgi:catechol 2,3-dioxygenase-like lactoylglutathione lyase family enzyme
MPDITGLYYVGLSVRDIRKSMAWYAELLGLTIVSERIADDSSTSEVLLRHPGNGMLLGLLAHRLNPGDAFSEFRTGVDHLEFGVVSRRELEAWKTRLDELGIDHSPIKERPTSLILTFRDPDNIQLEFFYPKS